MTQLTHKKIKDKLVTDFPRLK